MSWHCDVQVMKVVNDLIRVPELNQTMQQMSREMMKAGLIEETMSEMMDDAFDTDDIEEDADAEVDKVACLLPWWHLFMKIVCIKVWQLEISTEALCLCVAMLLDMQQISTLPAKLLLRQHTLWICVRGNKETAVTQ